MNWSKVVSVLVNRYTGIPERLTGFYLDENINHNVIKMLLMIVEFVWTISKNYTENYPQSAQAGPAGNVNFSTIYFVAQVQ